MEARGGDFFDGVGSEEFFAAEIFDGGGDVGPAGVLDEDGADDDFKGSAAGPPMLGAVSGEEGVVIGEEGGVGGNIGGRGERGHVGWTIASGSGCVKNCG